MESIYDCKPIIETFIRNHPNTTPKPRNYLEAVAMYNRTLKEDYGTTTMDEISHQYKLNILLKEAESLKNKETRFVWPYNKCPYFTYEEVVSLKGFYYNEAMTAGGYDSGDSALGYGGKSLHKRVIELQDELRQTVDPEEIGRIKKDLEALGFDSIETSVYEAQATQFDPNTWDKKIRILMNQLRSAEDPDDIGYIKEKIVSMGWNPEVDYTAENQVKARTRIESILQERYCKNTPTDISPLVESFNDLESVVEANSKEEVKPIHLVLVHGTSGFSGPIMKVTNSDFSHSAICLDNDFTKLYSYNLDNKMNFTGGFSLENIKNYNKDSRVAIFTFFVKKEDWDNINKRVQMLLDDIKSTSYSVLNILTLPFKNINLNMPESMICSQFVDGILKMGKVDITGRNSSKVVPGELYNKASVNSKAYKIYDGPAGSFDNKKTERFINKMSRTAKPYSENSIQETNIYENFTVVISEARKFPVEIGPEGDVLFTNPHVDFDAEYSASHKLLMKYDEAKNYEGMKYELARLYYMNYVLEKRIHSKLYSKDHSKNTKTRARVLNDFNKYAKILLKAEPDFNFGEYYEKSVFYPHTVEVKKSTLMSIKDIINYIL